MDAQQFLAEFRSIANAPGGIDRLRDLILQLAVAGDLVSVDPPVGDPQLLERILQQKWDHDEKKKVIPKQASVPPGMVTAPSHWNVCRLGDIALTITGGGTPSKSHPEYWHGDIPWASVKDLKGFQYLERTEDHITEKGLRNSSANLIPPGRVIVCTRMGLGKVAINRIAMAINQDLKALELPQEINPNFFLLVYKTREVRGTGMTVAGIKQDELLALPVAIPPKEEQSRIVAKVDELMALCDQLEQQQQDRRKLQNALRQSILQAMANAQSPHELQTSWQRLQANFGLLFSDPQDVSDLRKSIHDLAVSGRLTINTESDRSAAALKDEILAANEATISIGTAARKKHVKPEELQETVLPSHWESITLDDAISSIDAGWSPACLPSTRDDESKWGVLKTTSVQPLRFLPHEHKELPASLDPRSQYQVNVGDILITRAGPRNRVGICCVVDIAPPRLMISDKLIRFHIVDDLIDPNFVALCLSAGEPGRIIERLKSGMAESQMNISQDKLRSITIPLPPIEEQRRILKKLEVLMLVIDVLEDQLNTSLDVCGKTATAAVAALTGIAANNTRTPQ